MDPIVQIDIEWPGTRPTWLEIEDLGADGLRLTGHDWSVRVGLDARSARRLADFLVAFARGDTAPKGGG